MPSLTADYHSVSHFAINPTQGNGPDRGPSVDAACRNGNGHYAAPREQVTCPACLAIVPQDWPYFNITRGARLMLTLRQISYERGVLLPPKLRQSLSGSRAPRKLS